MTRHGFNNDWSIKTRKPIPDQRFSFSYGHSFRLGNGADLALNGALNYSYATRTFSNMENSRYGVYNKVEDKPEYYYKYTDDQYQTNVKVGALLNLAYLNGKNRYYFRNISTRSDRTSSRCAKAGRICRRSISRRKRSIATPLAARTAGR